MRCLQIFPSSRLPNAKATQSQQQSCTREVPNERCCARKGVMAKVLKDFLFSWMLYSQLSDTCKAQIKSVVSTLLKRLLVKALSTLDLPLAINC